MRDYEKLVKGLKYCFEHDDCGSRCPYFSPTTVCADERAKEAADAIEELLKENGELENSGRVLMAAFARLKEKVPKWISVEERLPKKKVGDKGYVGYLVLSDGEYQIADFTHDKYMQTAYEFHVDGEYDPNITHWMELPPKEVE